MHSFSVRYPAEWAEMRLYILSDLHIGDPHASLNNIYYRINQVKDDPHGVCILNGDIMNTATRNSISDVYGEKLSPMDQINEAVSMLRPVADKIIGADAGNHENRVYKNDGVDISRLICRELGVEDRYAPEGFTCFLSFGEGRSHRAGSRKQPITYVIYATHGTGGGRKEGAKMIRLADMASIVDADIYIHSHTHLPGCFKEAFHRTDVHNKKVISVDKLFCNDSSALVYGGYGQMNEYKPMSNASPVIYLSGTSKWMTGTV